MNKSSIALKYLTGFLAAAALAAAVASARAASGTWSADSAGTWSDPGNWSGGTIADGDTFTADFSTVDLAADRTVTLDSARVLSTLIFGDAGLTPDHNWTLDGANVLTLGTAPVINVVNQSTAIAVPLAGTTGLTKIGQGTLNFLGTNSYTGTTVISNGVVNYTGASKSTGSGIFNVGGAAGRAVVNVNTTGSLTNNGAYYGVGGTQPGTTDTGVGVLNLIAGTLNNGANNNYTEIGTGSTGGTGSYGCINLQSGATFNTLGSSGIRIGAGGIGIFNQTGGTLNCSRWFAVGSQAGGGNTAAGIGVVNFLGGTATIASGNRIIMPDKVNGVAIVNLGTEAGGTATVSALNTSTTAAGIDFLDQGGDAALAALNLNSGTLRLAGPMYRNNAAGTAEINWNGATLQAAGNMNLVSTANNFGTVNVYNGGVVIDSQANTVTSAAQFAQPGGSGIYPAGGTLALAGNGGEGYLAQPYVTVSTTGSGTGAKAIATVANGAVTGIVLTCPGQNYGAGDEVDFIFTGGGATTPAGVFAYTLQAADVAPNTAGGLTKLGSGLMYQDGASTYTGDTVVGAGTLDVRVDGGLGRGNVNVSSGATLILENGAAGDYIDDAANLVISSGGVVNLNFAGTDTINGLSLDGGATYVAPGTYGPSGSGATFTDDVHFAGYGVIEVTTTPTVTLTVTLASSVNPTLHGQAVTFTATVASTGGGTPSGSVTFKDGTGALGAANLDGSGKATLTTTNLAVGSHPITATYGSTTSQILVQVVNLAIDVWSGAAGGAWDINGTLNWKVNGTAAVYEDGNDVQFDDTATGTTTVSLGVPVSPHTFAVTNNSKPYVIAGTGGINGATGLTKDGTGSLVLDTANTYGGPTLVNGGGVSFATNASSTGAGSLVVGGTNGSAIVTITTTNTLNFGGVVTAGGNTGNNDDTGQGAIRQQSGTVNSSSAYIELGAGGYNTYGTYELNGGVLNTINSTGIRVGAQGIGTYLQSGGTLNCGRYFAVGTQTANNGTGGNGVATFTGGTAIISPSFRIIVGDKPNATAVLNLGTEAGGNATIVSLYNNGGTGGLEILGDVAASSGILNLNSGVLQLGGAIYRVADVFGTSALNLNGGTLQAGDNNINLITNVPSANTGDFVASLYNHGVVVDSLTNYCYISADLVPASGSGVYPAGGKLPVASGGSGYLGAPVVVVSGGSGSGLTAIATVTNGTIVNVLLTCPGRDYQAGDQLFFDFLGGGATTPANTLVYTVTAGVLQANATGGLVKVGSGQLDLTSGNNSYTGITVVSNGTLNITGSLNGGGAVLVRGGLLAGTGSILGDVTVSSGAALTAGITNAGTLTLVGSLTFEPGATCYAKLDQGQGTQDLVQGLNQLTYAGTLNVTNLSGTLAVNDSFKLFDAAIYHGAFATIVPATPGVGLAWDTSELASSGTLKIAPGSAVNPNPTNLLYTVSGGTLSLEWPADHTGWHLQMQVNAPRVGLGTNWVEVPAATATNKMTFPLNATNGSVFFRLVL